MFRNLLLRTLPAAALVLTTTLTSVSTTLAADDQAQLPSTTTVAEHWTRYGFDIVAPSDMWPLLELLHTQHFDWELASASRMPTPLTWATLPAGVYGSYVPGANVVRLSRILQNESVELGTAFLAHELTHLTDDLNGKLGDLTGDACYEAETRAFVNEANFWQMVNGPLGKPTTDVIEDHENQKMFAFVGNNRYADLVVRTTASYIKQCGPAK